MRSQPNRNYVSNDVVQTPPSLALALAQHFRPMGKCLEPCRGVGNIFRCLPLDTEWCEILEGRDYLLTEFEEARFNWILTNPPWSKIRPFLAKAMHDANNVVFLMTVNHVWTKARLRIVSNAGFGIREIALVETPASFPPTGFQLGAVWFKRGYHGPVDVRPIDWPRS